MKLVKLVIAALVVVSMGSCMKGDDTPPFDEQAWLEQLEKEKVIIRNHVAEHYPEANFIESDAGIWYEILEEGDPESYTYKFNESVNRYVFPTATVNYTVHLLNGTQIDENQTEDGVPFALGSTNLIEAWRLAFFPQKIGEREVGGLTEEGLKVGSEIRFITPSAYAYGNQANEKVPANSPLIFKLKVLNIKD